MADFLTNYAAFDNEQIWPAEDVFNFYESRTQMLGIYIVKYPDIFIDAVADSGVTQNIL
jgi:hypothetical protein